MLLPECRAIATDSHGAAWIGSEAGNVKRIDLCSKQVTGSETKVWLELNLTLRPLPKSRRSSITFSHAASSDMDELAKADFGRKNSAESNTASEAGTNGAGGGFRAHTGPVAAIATKGQFVFTSGGPQSSAMLHQWGQNGTLHRSHKLADLGEEFCPVWCDTFCQEQFISSMPSEVLDQQQQLCKFSM